ncbi:MAG: helix-turn-helix domain-containing protein [Candidatus Aminicenantes bacterium]
MKVLISALGFRQKDLATRLNISTASLSDIELFTWHHRSSSSILKI